MDESQRPLDLGAYFARVGFDAPASPTLETLAALHERHAEAIPFENLSPFLGEPVRLDCAALQEKLVARERGGWCFEHNLLFAQVLEAIGFPVRRLAARVRWNVPPGVVTSRSHMLMQVMVAGEPWIADVGFGGQTLTAPLRLVAGVEQPTPHETYRLTPEDGGFVLEARMPEGWRALYFFEMHEQQLADYEVSNWYLANFPQSHFVTSVVAARSGEGVRHALRGNRYSVHRADGTTDRRFAANAAELIGWLEGPFGIRVPRSAKLEEKVAKLVESPA